MEPLLVGGGLQDGRASTATFASAGADDPKSVEIALAGAGAYAAAREPAIRYAPAHRLAARRGQARDPDAAAAATGRGRAMSRGSALKRSASSWHDDHATADAACANR